MKIIIRLIKTHPIEAVLIITVLLIIIFILCDYSQEGRSFFEQIGYEIGKIGKAIADGFAGK